MRFSQATTGCRGDAAPAGPIVALGRPLGKPVLLRGHQPRHDAALINVSSQLAEVARPGPAAYRATKGAVRMLTRGPALGLAPHGVRVNVIGPGVTRTSRTAPRLQAPEQYEWTIQRIPLGRVGEPEDLAGAAIFLAGNDSA